MTNTPRMTSKHMDTMDELRDSVRQFVGKGKVVSIEEGRMLRLVQAASDEATMLDYTFALLSCGFKENGVFGQRFDQLFREAEAFRAGNAGTRKGCGVVGRHPIRRGESLIKRVKEILSDEQLDETRMRMVRRALAAAGVLRDLQAGSRVSRQYRRHDAG